MYGLPKSCRGLTFALLFFAGANAVISDPPKASVPSEANPEAFESRLKGHIQKQRQLWSEDQCSQLARFIHSELQAKLGDQLTAHLRSSILASFEFDFKNFTVYSNLKGIPQDQYYKLAHEYYRWAIADLSKRRSMTAVELEQTEKSIKDGISTLSKRIGKDYTSEFAPIISEAATAVTEKLTRSINDPLYPGLKQALTASQIEKINEEAYDFSKNIRKNFLDNGRFLKGPTATNTNKTAALTQLAKQEIAMTFGIFQSEMLASGVTFDGGYQKQLTEYSQMVEKIIEKGNKAALVDVDEMKRRQILDARPDED